MQHCVGYGDTMDLLASLALLLAYSSCLFKVTCSGKLFSLLQAILRELPITAGKCLITGRVAFASQEPWIFSGTLRQNILFGRPFNQHRYEEIVNACALDIDFMTLPLGDNTEVGERGITLSGGQKARISLARALYQGGDIYLLDDPISAVDSRVSRHMFDKCLKKYLSKSLRILVTHQLQYLPQADLVLVFNEGKILAQGTFQELLDQGIDFVNILTSETEESVSFRRASLTKLEETEKEVKKDQETRASHVEKMAAGAVSWKTYWKYFRLGNSYGSMIAVFCGFIIAQLLYSSTDWWLAFWTNAEEQYAKTTKVPEFYPIFQKDHFNKTATIDFEGLLLNHSVPRGGAALIPQTLALTSSLSSTPSSKIEPPEGSKHSSRNLFNLILGSISYRGQNFYIAIYTVFVLSVALSTNLKAICFFRYCMRISINMHQKMFSSVVRAPMKFFDDTPSGRIMNRFTKDLSSLDENFPAALIDVIEIFLVMIGVIVIVVMSNPYVIAPSTLLIISLIFIRSFYIKTARDVKRLEAITKSPLFTHLTASVQGLTTIRASKRQTILIEQFNNLLDVHSSAWFLFISSNRWFGIWLELISVLFLACVTFSFLLLSMNNLGGSVGLAISSVLTLTGTFQWGMRQSAEVENLATSMERLIEYTKIEPEAPLESDPDKKPPPNWPTAGNIQFRNVSLAYDNKEVLKNLSFEIKAGERVGVIGRTGAGKSSILSAMLRITEPTGDILIDGVRVNDLGVHEIRKNISSIPQDPLLFGNTTMRYNLDPFNQYSDDKLWEVLEEVELKPIIPALDMLVLDGGINFSIGQKQAICMARAILRKNKIIVMDEATANCDLRTDHIIQSTIQKKFADCTLIVIAHRLHTVMDCDKILVMENGQLKEYDHPHILMKDVNGLLYSMSRHTGKASHEYLKNIAQKLSESLVSLQAYLRKHGIPFTDGSSSPDPPVPSSPSFPPSSQSNDSNYNSNSNTHNNTDDSEYTSGSDAISSSSDDTDSDVHNETVTEHSRLLNDTHDKKVTCID